MLQVFKPKWKFPHEIETWLAKKAKGNFTLHLPCGSSQIGDVRADVDPSVNPDIICDLHHPPFRNQAFDMVISDPPWRMYAKFKWIHKLSDLARKTLILNSPTFIFRLKNFLTDIELVTRTNRPFITVWLTYTRKQTTLDLVNNS